MAALVESLNPVTEAETATPSVTIAIRATGLTDAIIDASTSSVVIDAVTFVPDTEADPENTASSSVTAIDATGDTLALRLVMQSSVVIAALTDAPTEVV